MLTRGESKTLCFSAIALMASAGSAVGLLMSQSTVLWFVLILICGVAACVLIASARSASIPIKVWIVAVSASAGVGMLAAACTMALGLQAVAAVTLIGLTVMVLTNGLINGYYDKPPPLREASPGDL